MRQVTSSLLSLPSLNLTAKEAQKSIHRQLQCRYQAINNVMTLMFELLLRKLHFME